MRALESALHAEGEGMQAEDGFTAVSAPLVYQCLPLQSPGPLVRQCTATDAIDSGNIFFLLSSSQHPRVDIPTRRIHSLGPAAFGPAFYSAARVPTYWMAS
jgi:hypothetical protein